MSQLGFMLSMLPGFNIWPVILSSYKFEWMIPVWDVWESADADAWILLESLTDWKWFNIWLVSIHLKGHDCAHFHMHLHKFRHAFNCASHLKSYNIISPRCFCNPQAWVYFTLFHKAHWQYIRTFSAFNTLSKFCLVIIFRQFPLLNL